MRAVVWHGKEDVRVDDVPDPVLVEPTDAIVRVTSTAICGSDLHLYAKLGPVMREGDILGHEAMGVVEEVGNEVHHIAAGDRVVVPFNISCGACYFCARQLYSQCERTRDEGALARAASILRRGKGASLFGYTHLYGAVPGGQAELLRVPQAHFGPIKVPDGPPDHRFLYLSDVLPTAWQAVAYADVQAGSTVGVWGLGPIGQMCARIARHQGAGRVMGIDRVPERLAMAARHGVETIDFEAVASVRDVVLQLTEGRGVDSAIDAVGMEATGSTMDTVLQATKIQPDKTHVLRECLASVRRGGTVSVAGVYGGPVHMFPFGDLFDMQVTLRMGQANVRRWTDDILPLVLSDNDPLGLEDLTTHFLALEEAPRAYKLFQEKRDRCIKVVLDPAARKSTGPGVTGRLRHAWKDGTLTTMRVALEREAVGARRSGEVLDGDWRVERISGVLPSNGVTKHIHGGAGVTRVLGLRVGAFRVRGLSFAYRFVPIRDELTPGPAGSWEGRALLLGREFCRFRLTRAPAPGS